MPCKAAGFISFKRNCLQIQKEITSHYHRASTARRSTTNCSLHISLWTDDWTYRQHLLRVVLTLKKKILNCNFKNCY